MAGNQAIDSIKCTPEECREIDKQARQTHPVLDDDLARKQHAMMFRALGNETRLRIVGMLSLQDMCTCDIVAGLSGAASTTTHHLRVLEDGGLIHSRKVGKFTIYSLDEALIAKHQVFG
ncbi:MAG: metalloregulator ArsR/SmtB family transcription factor [Aquificales bacterium]|nr:metalloregulator ArsR/SmtB family transcription factor [Aquificales bacterium]